MAPRSAERSINTCRNCRRRKIRCDRTRPRCNRCRESGTTCVYEDQLPQPAPTYRFVEETPGESSGAFSQPSQGAEPAAAITISSDRLQNIEDRVETLSRMVRTLQAQSTTSSAASAGPSSVAASTTDVSNASIQEPEPVADLTGHLSLQDGGMVRYVEPSFWASMCNEVAELDDLLSNQARYLLKTANGATSTSDDEDEREFEEDGIATQRREAAAHAAAARPSSSPDHRLRLDDPSFAQGDVETIRTVAHYPEFLQELPPNALCDVLLDGYVQGYHPIAPLIHVPSFREKFEDFKGTRDDSSATATASMSFAALVVATCYAGSVANPDSVRSYTESGPKPEEVAIRLHKLGIKALRLANFPRTPTIDTFIAYLILQSTWMRSEEPLTCVAFAGLAVRVANMLGLHKDPSHFASVISPVEAEVRRRAWWQLVHIDTLVALSAGLPPILDLYSWDVKGVSELKEEMIGTPEGENYEFAVKNKERIHDRADDPTSSSNQSMVSTAGILAIGKFRYTLVLRRSLARTFTGSSLTQSSASAMRHEFELLCEDLKWRISRIPGLPFGSQDEQGMAASFENYPGLNKFARLLLSAYIDEKYALVLHPILKSPMREFWPDLYPLAIERCQSFLIKCAQLASAEDFRCFNWSWPGNHQPLHAVMVLLMDLIQTPDVTSAARSRLMIDLIFALLGPTGGVVAGGTDSEIVHRSLTEGGQETWHYLRRLRMNAWSKCGWDPNTLWSREEAIQYCNNPEQLEIRLSDPGYCWSPSNPVPIENIRDVASSPEGGFAGFGDVMMSPPNIDWDYLDAVLSGRLEVSESDFPPAD